MNFNKTINFLPNCIYELNKFMYKNSTYKSKGKKLTLIFIDFDTFATY